MPKIKIDKPLYERAQKACATAGYADVDEFILHVIEKEVAQFEKTDEEDDAAVQERLRGLGYIE